MYIPAWTHTCMDTTHCQETCRLHWSLTLCVFVCVCLSLCWCNGQGVQADGRLDDGRLSHTGFPAPPRCFLSPPFLYSASVHVFVFYTPHIFLRSHILSLGSVKYCHCWCLWLSTPLGCPNLFPAKAEELAVKLEYNTNFLPHWHLWLSVNVGFWCFDSNSLKASSYTQWQQKLLNSVHRLILAKQSFCFVFCQFLFNLRRMKMVLNIFKML